MSMKFPGKCTECGKQLKAGETGMWQKGVGVRHEGCGQTRELACTVCGGPAGCRACEFRDVCNLERVSQLCLCSKCMDRDGAFALYLESSTKLAKC